MTHLFQLDTVKYICCCGSLEPICSVYFCRYCQRLRCRYCVSHEVDSLYCVNCSDNIPTAEAKLKRNKCSSCYNCPSCFQSLSIKAVTTVLVSTESAESGGGDVVPEEEKPTKKSFYLKCNYCRWSSRDAGIPDMPSPTGPWPESENPLEKEINDMCDYYRMLSIREKNLKGKKQSKFGAAGRRLLSKKFPGNSMEEYNREIPPPRYVAQVKSCQDLEDELQLSWSSYGSKEKDTPEESESEEQRRKNFFEMDLELAKFTNMEQRCGQLDNQPRLISGLLPTRKKLVAKKSLRCRVCEHNISKPEYSSQSIKFKILLNAYYHVPHVRLLEPFSGSLEPGKRAQVLLRLANPTQFPTRIKFLPLSFVPLISSKGKLDLEGQENRNEMNQESSTETDNPAGVNIKLSKEIQVLPIRNEAFIVNCDLCPPSAEIVLPPRDETTDYDDDVDDLPSDFSNDPTVVQWRKANVAIVLLEFTPNENIKTSSPLLGLTIEYDYVNTVIDPLESKESSTTTPAQKVRLQNHLLIALDPSVPE